MKRTWKRIVLPALVVAIVLVAFPATAGVPKVTICHYPPGNPENAQTITVGMPAVPAHVVLHGDDIGVCDAEPPPEA